MSSIPEIKQDEGIPKKTDKQNWMESVFGCIKPVLSLIGRDFNSLNDIRTRGDEDWEIPFEIISGKKSLRKLKGMQFQIFYFFLDLEWLGSGAQGAVFSGKLGPEIVAVKKVKDVRETDIRHLRKLCHENIVKFK
jgi:hypothetical protein